MPLSSVVYIMISSSPSNIFHSYNLPFIKFKIMSLPVNHTVLEKVPKSKVLLMTSTKPNGNIAGIQPRAYSIAKAPPGMAYCLTWPFGKW